MKKRSTLRNFLIGITAGLALASPIKAEEYSVLQEAEVGPRINDLSSSKPWVYVERNNRKILAFRWPNGDLYIASGSQTNLRPLPKGYHEAPGFKQSTGVSLYASQDNKEDQSTLTSTLNQIPESTKKQIARMVVMPTPEFNQFQGDKKGEVGAVTLGKEIYFLTRPTVSLGTHEAAHVRYNSLDSIMETRNEETIKALPLLEQISNENNRSPQDKKFLDDQIKRIGKSPHQRLLDEWTAVSNYPYGTGVVNVPKFGPVWNKPEIKELSKFKEYADKREEIVKEANSTSNPEMLKEWNRKLTHAYDACKMLSGPADGMVTPYAATNIKEDIAETVAAVYASIPMVRELANPDSPKFDKRVRGKIDLLLKYGFIEQRDYNKVVQSGKTK